MILLECLHAQFHVSSPHRLSHTCLSQMREKHRFQNKRFLFSKTYYRVSVNILDYPSRRITGSFFRNSHGSAFEMNYWTTLQGNSSENLPLKFLSQPFFIFHFFHAMHSHLIFLGCPGAYEMHYAISKSHMLIYQLCIY